MNTKQLVIDTIRHEPVPRIPMMYRGDPAVNRELARSFNLDSVEEDWEKIVQNLGADIFSDGETLGAFSIYIPKYVGPEFNAVYELNNFAIWGIKPIAVEIAGTTDVVFHKNPPLYNLDSVSDLRTYRYPEIDWFDFDVYKLATDAVYKEFDEQEDIHAHEVKRSKQHFLSTCTMNSIFMTSIFMRGFDKMLIDLVANKTYAEILIGNIGEFYTEFCVRNLAKIGNEIDVYGIWDDFATQDDLMISPELWRKFYKPWHRRIIAEAKKYDLFVCFHVCGNCSEIIPDLIDMGVDILDPVQVSARNMEISRLKRQFGEHICFHGGLDAQKMIPLGIPEDIRKERERVKTLFMNEGGIILGPSHYITPDTPLENILAIYR
jgi:uroporphyrinogen decarboxylase